MRRGEGRRPAGCRAGNWDLRQGSQTSHRTLHPPHTPIAGAAGDPPDGPFTQGTSASEQRYRRPPRDHLWEMPGPVSLSPPGAPSSGRWPALGPARRFSRESPQREACGPQPLPGSVHSGSHGGLRLLPAGLSQPGLRHAHKRHSLSNNQVGVAALVRRHTIVTPEPSGVTKVVRKPH